MIELKNVTAGYHKKVVLHDVSLAIKPNKITVIIGPNGAGKSTLLKVIYGLLPMQKGSFCLDGDSFAPTPNLLTTKGITMIPQGFRVFKQMSVLENLELATHFWKDRKIFPERLQEILTYFPDLADRLNEKAGNLSGGQQQMVALARGLINKPKIMLLDEPSIGLSPKLINELFHKIKHLNSELGMAFVIVEHNLKTLLPLTDHAYILEQGKIIYDGPSEAKNMDRLLNSIFKH